MFPELWRAPAVGMNASRVLFQGAARQGNQADPDARLIKQEWAVQVMVEPPPGLPACRTGRPRKMQIVSELKSRFL